VIGTIRWECEYSPKPRPIQPLESGRIIAIQEVGGLHHRAVRPLSHPIPPNPHFIGEIVAGSAVSIEDQLSLGSTFACIRNTSPLTQFP
jgi:hypothetical protein